jgi:hypothetical protein
MGEWTSKLRERLTKLGVSVAGLSGDDSQHAAWKQFDRGEVEILLLMDPPDFYPPNLDIHQLIIMSPLRPVSEISAMVDWALEHTEGRSPLRIDLLYVVGTPEEQAVLELKQTCFADAYSNSYD